MSTSVEIRGYCENVMSYVMDMVEHGESCVFCKHYASEYGEQPCNDCITAGAFSVESKFEFDNERFAP